MKLKLEDVETKVVMGGSKYTVDWGVEQLRNELTRLGGDNVAKATQDWYNQNKAQFDQFVKDSKK
jgi:putative aldouronate transport system substrate-binding protein